MLVHICCSVDSHFFLEKLKDEFPNDKLIGYFYNPNIHPYSEYQLRLIDVKNSCKKLDIELLEGEYSLNRWLNITKGLEAEKEKGKRCEVCFDDRLIKSAKKAKELNITKYTTTLLVSPLKSQTTLKNSAKKVDEELSTNFIFVDYRKYGGTQQQSIVSKKNQLYRQNYCGCFYALNIQRKHQQKLASELISPINRQILPASIEEKKSLYLKRCYLESQGIDYKIVKNSFLNYRLLSALLKIDNNPLKSYILIYSTLKKESKTKVDFRFNDILYTKKDSIKLISINSINKILNRDFKSIDELNLTYQDEIEIREYITNTKFDTTPIVIINSIDNIKDNKLTLSINSKLYQDVIENLLIL